MFLSMLKRGESGAGERFQHVLIPHNISHNKHKTHNTYQQQQQKALNYVEIQALAEQPLYIFHSIRGFVFDPSSFIWVYQIILAPHFTHFWFFILRIKINFNQFSKTFTSVLEAVYGSTNIDIRKPGHNIIFSNSM